MLSPIPTQRELEALKILWEEDRATVRQIWNRLRGTDSELAYTTVLSLMQAMEQKGLVGHEPVGRAYVYYPRVERDRTFGRLVRGFIDKVFDGATDEYLVHALEMRHLKPDELDKLEKTIARAKKRARSRSKKGGRS